MTAYVVKGKMIDQNTIKLSEPLPLTEREVSIIVEPDPEEKKVSRKAGIWHNKIHISPDFNETFGFLMIGLHEMKYLIDTNILLWYSSDDHHLPCNIKSLIDSNVNEIYVSIISLWEIALKYSIGKLRLDCPLSEFFDSIENAWISNTYSHRGAIIYSANLPFHHNDPFDRLIFSQSMVEGLSFFIFRYDFRSLSIIVVTPRSRSL